MKRLPIAKKSIALMIGLALIVGLVSFSFVPVTSVQAESNPAITPRATLNAAIDQVMTNVFHEEQNWLLIQQNNLSEANLILGQLNRLIQAAQNEGKDVSSLKTLQGTLTSLINSAQSNHGTASQILSSHNGFDASGNVTSRADAHNTLSTAHQSLLNAHLSIVQAAEDLRAALLAYRTKNQKPIPTTTGS